MIALVLIALALIVLALIVLWYLIPWISLIVTCAGYGLALILVPASILAAVEERHDLGLWHDVAWLLVIGLFLTPFAFVVCSFFGPIGGGLLYLLVLAIIAWVRFGEKSRTKTYRKISDVLVRACAKATLRRMGALGGLTMTRRQFCLALTVMAVSGLVGGALATWLLPERAAVQEEQAAANEIRAERFVLVDANGRHRAMLNLFDGEPQLALADEAGDIRAGLSLADDEPRMVLCNAAGQPRAGLALVDGTPGLRLDDASGQSRVVLGSTETEDTRTGVSTKFPPSTITLFDETGRVRWQAP